MDRLPGPGADDAGDLDGEGEAASFVVPPEQAGERLDRFVASRLPDLSRTRIQDVIAGGGAGVGGATATVASRKLKAGDTVTFAVPPAEDAVPPPQDIPLAVVHEDADLIVIDKPAGMVVHPASGHATGTLVNALLHHCGGSLSGVGGVRRPGIVHRLDKDTSGLIVAAKHDRAHRALQEQFADHGRTGPLRRLYVAFVWGRPDRTSFTVEAAIDRSSVNRERMAVVGDGKGRHAITHVAVTQTYAGQDGSPAVSRLECRLETGRTHQIRVHLAHLGHPLLGDPLYGAGFRTKAALLAVPGREALAALARQALHAAELGFRHPVSGETLLFHSELPSDLALLQEALTAS
jgi:23S rRNA pseudouridine1911/1915/1917 synthase